ncbi:hypothetical protein KFU94_39160 [Chloroflexi bacterium TSY]|nr:hypothetical protein [Chloroflexi bacterium TSY]
MRIFNEQQRVLPVYISFARYLHRTNPIDAYEFAREYFVGLLRSYLAFRYRQPALLDANMQYEQLRAFSEKVEDEITSECKYDRLFWISCGRAALVSILTQ